MTEQEMVQKIYEVIKLVDCMQHNPSVDFNYLRAKGAYHIIKNQIEHIESENEQLKQTLSKMETVEKELKARLEKAVELPCKVGDTVYSVFKFPNEKTVLKGTCKHININICSGFPEIFIKLVFETNEQLFLRTYSGNDLNNIFLLRSEAEARLAELRKGEKE